MENGNGFVKIYRCMLDNPIVCKDSEHLSVWVYLLLNATHKEIDAVFKNERITLKKGQLITGRKVIAEKLSLNEYKVQRILKLFESEHQIAQQTSSRNRLITIVNWQEYQISAQQNAQQLHTNKNERIKEYIPKGIYEKVPTELIDPLNAYMQMRVKIKKPMTDRAVTTLLNKLNKLSNGNLEKSIKLLDEATLHNWQSVYPLKEETSSEPKYNIVN